MKPIEEGNLPSGFVVPLAENHAAMAAFSGLREDEKDEMIAYIQRAYTEDEIKDRIEQVIESLENMH